MFKPVISILLKGLRGMDTPVQWAGGLALGMVAGMLPPDSLLVVFFGLAILLSGSNLLTGIAGWGAGACLAMALAEWTEPCGYWILTRPGWQGLWVTVSELPLGVWCRWNDSRVAGGLAIGIPCGLLAFGAACLLGSKLRRWLTVRLAGNRWTRWLAEDRINTQAGPSAAS